MPTKKTQTKKSPAPLSRAKIAPAKKHHFFSHDNSWLLILNVLLLALLFILVVPKFLHGNKNTAENTGNTTEVLAKLEKGDQLITYKGKNWILSNDVSMEVFIVNDKTCGQSCDTTKTIDVLKKQLTPSVLVKEIDISSAEGKQLKEKFNITFVPAFIFGKGFSDLQKGGIRAVDQLKAIYTENNGQYFIDSRKVGFPIGKFLTLPVFDNKSNPSYGKGKVTIIEFTDLQCPFCARFHKENKEVLNKLVQDGKITYVVKDYPLPMHKESMTAHIVARCGLKLGGIDTYTRLRDKIFENQILWNEKTNAKEILMKFAQDEKLDAKKLETCFADPEITASINKDIQSGKAINVNGTPTLFIGKQMFPGVIGSDMIERAIQQESTEAQTK